MAFKNIIVRLRQALLCCSKRDRNLSLDIGSPTNVRHMDISESLPGLTDSERKYIREKASSDAIHLLGLQSQPPSHPPSPTSTSPASSREPSVALLNAASANLPLCVPTPPRHTHAHYEAPEARMKSMRSVSTASYEEDIEPKAKGLSDSFMTSNLEFPWEGDNNDNDNRSAAVESARSLDVSEGFEMQDTMGGAIAVKMLVGGRGKDVKEPLMTVVAAESGSDSEGDDVVAMGMGGTRPLVRA